MSYCVYCGVELDQTARACPLCGTPVVDPAGSVDTVSPRPYPTRSTPVEPPGKREVAKLLTAVLVSVAAVCALLNLFLDPSTLWSLYVVGGAVSLWLWVAPSLLWPRLPLWGKLLIDGGAAAGYLLLIAWNVNGLDWYLGLALPMTLTWTALALGLGFFLPGRSILTSVTLLLGATGCYCLAVELFIDLWTAGRWRPVWSLVVSAACAAAMAVLVTVRAVPSLRELVRRKFHL